MAGFGSVQAARFASERVAHFRSVRPAHFVGIRNLESGKFGLGERVHGFTLVP